MGPRPNDRPSYVPLRVHGHHSLLTGVDAPRALLERARALGLPALALCDVDTLAGSVDFLRAAADGGVRPIVGAELSDPSGTPGRLIALVQDERGWGNLCRLVSARQLGDDPGRPGARLEGPAHFDLVSAAARHREGLVFLADHPRLLVALHGRVASEDLFAAVSPAALRVRGNGASGATEGPAAGSGAGGWARSASRTGTYRAGGPPIDAAPSAELDANKTPPPSPPAPAAELLAAARATGVAALAVPDVYHATPEGARDHRVRVAIKHNALLHDLPADWLAAAPSHLPSTDEMCAFFEGQPDVPGPFEAPHAGALPPLVARTLQVAARCTFTPPLGGVLFPEVELEAGETPWSKLYQVAFGGATRRYRPLKPEVVRRLDYELGTIERLGFAPYFLLVKRIADFARERGIPCVGRGSAADSLVSYCLELTDADPLRYNLPFERFLNPARSDRPDIDLDFCWRRRDEVLEHVYEAFGSERTAMIATLNTFGLRSAFRESALVEGFPPVEVSRWSRRLPWAESNAAQTRPPEDGGPLAQARLEDNVVARALARTPECRDFPFDDPRWTRVLRAAARLLGTPRHFGLHPGGVVVSPGAITDVVSCRRAAKGMVVTELDKDAVEAVGLVKMDLLGNRALTTIDDCLKELARRGIELDLEGVRENDEETARLLSEGRTLGCFQIESPGMRNLLQQTGAADMDAVIQAVALIRPGPAGSGMKDAYVRRFRGLEERRAPHPRLTDLLWDTYGVMLYQEDVMQVAARMAGMDLAEADLLRRTLQKQRGDGLTPLRRRFLAGAEENGIERAAAAEVWELIANFSSFAFCKAHAVTYGRIAYRAAYLKAHFPAVFLTSFLASETGYYEPRAYVEEARRLGVPVLPPDVNRSAPSFTVEWTRADQACLRVGLEQVRGLSAASVARLIEARERGGPFLSLPDLLERTGVHVDEAENLIQCGALDAFDRTRPELTWRLHLLRGPTRRAPRRSAADELTRTLDPGRLEACRATPASRERAALERAHARAALERGRARTGGWSGRGLGLGAAELAPGQTASLFPEPETPGLVLPGLPDLDARTRGLAEMELLGFPLEGHPVRLFPCAADARIAERFGGLREAEAPRRGELRPVNPLPCRRVHAHPRGRITLRGWLAASRRVRTESGEWMRFLTLEDESGLAEVVLFPDVYRRDGQRLIDRGPHCVSGIVEDHLGACTLRAERIW